VTPAINIDGQALTGNAVDLSATITGFSVAKDVAYPDVRLTATISTFTIAKDAKTPDVAIPKGYLKEIGLFENVAYPNVTIPKGYIESVVLLASATLPSPKISITINKDSFIFTADDAQLVRDRFAGQVTPKLTFGPQSIVFTADDAKIVQDRLAGQLTPKISLSDEGVIGADPKVMATINANIGKLLTPKIWVTDDGVISADPAKMSIIKDNLGDVLTPTISPIIEVSLQEQGLARTKIEQDIVPIITPILGEPSAQEIAEYQKRLDTLVKTKPESTVTSLGGLGNTLVKNGNATSANGNTGVNSLASDYITDLTNDFGTPENVLALATIGTGIRGAIDSGIRNAPTSDIGTEIVALINGQFFTEANVLSIKSIGGNVFELIIAGIRIAMQKKNNNVGQEIVDTIAAQVVTATADAITGD
jgi:hypothetical protein